MKKNGSVFGINLYYKKNMDKIIIKKEKEQAYRMKPQILPLQELERMSEEERLSALQQYRAFYTIKELTREWGLSNPIQYYMWLKKHKLYDKVVRRADKFDPSKEWKRLKEAERRERPSGVPADQFRYGLDTETTGFELSQVFRKLADFLYNENGRFRCRIELRALPQAQFAEDAMGEEEAGA